MSVDRTNCHICGVELGVANSFTCLNCGRSDICILHKGSSSGYCSVCLDRFRKRLIYPTFSVISLVIVIFSTYLFKAISILAFPVVLLLPFWLLVELSRPVLVVSKLRRIVVNILIVTVILVFALMAGWHLWTTGDFIVIERGIATTTFLILGIILLLLGFVYIMSTSLKGFGISFFNYDYPEEYSLMLKKAGRDPELISNLNWDLRWITIVNFVYGCIFFFLYLSSVHRG